MAAKGNIRTAHGLRCPHCLSSLTVRTNSPQHILLRILYVQCNNVMCGWTGTASLEIATQISPSAAPNPHIQLQQSLAVPLDQIELEV